MPPTLILIRHGEAEHNVARKWDIVDPRLTDRGRQQCRELQAHLQADCPLADRVDVIVASPFIRTVETALIGLDWLIRRGVRVEPNALWQENSAKVCDTGSDVSLLRARFPDIDFAALDPVFPKKTLGTKYAFTKEKVLARGQLALQQLHDRPEKVVAVVSHSGFLRTAVSRTWYSNADYRIFTFGQGLSLVESEDTKGTGGMGWSEPGIAELRKHEFPAEL